MKKINIFFLIFSFLNLILFEKKSLSKDLSELKVLHLSFHSGCISDFEFVANQIGINLTSLNVLAMPRQDWDEKSPGASIYNIGHDRAKRIWDKKKEYFDQFDIILTSDIAPLSRIFLQNGWDKPLIVWICNRFDYYDGATNDCGFPDNEYYNLIKNSLKNHKVKVNII